MSKKISAVLIANRGEIAVRVARACRDHGVKSIAIYSDEDRNSLHVATADEAYALNGLSAAESYLDQTKILKIAKDAGADAIHPGYGFLSENAEFAERVIQAGLVWIGPPPAAIRALGDKVSARKIAAKVGAPLVAGTADPVDSPDEVIEFAKKHGLPVAIKAAHGGGGRGLKVAFTLEEIPELFASAVREAIAGFGRGECFVERYLDKPRHVETQCQLIHMAMPLLSAHAIAHFNVVIKNLWKKPRLHFSAMLRSNSYMTPVKRSCVRLVMLAQVHVNS